MKTESSAEKISSTTKVAAQGVNFMKRHPLFIVSIVLALLLLIMTILYIGERGDDDSLVVPEDISSLSASDQDAVTKNVLSALSAVMLLPDEKDPIVASVTDANTLRGQQSFYAKSENGDVLVIFSASRQAVIYRPSISKIVNAGPLIIDENVQ